MKPKTSQGKKLAFGFLSRVGSKDKYAKRLNKLKQGILQGNSDLKGPLQQGGVMDKMSCRRSQMPHVGDGPKVNTALTSHIRLRASKCLRRMMLTGCTDK